MEVILLQRLFEQYIFYGFVYWPRVKIKRNGRDCSNYLYNNNINIYITKYKSLYMTI